MTKYKDIVGYVRFCWGPKCLNCLLNRHELMFVQVQMLSANEKGKTKTRDLILFSVCFQYVFFV